MHATMIDLNVPAHRHALSTLSDALRGLHHALLAATQREYERVHGRIGGAFEALKLVVEDPFFAWLRPVSALLAAIDEATASRDPSTLTPERTEALRSAAATLFAGDGPDAPFSERYLDLLQREPGVVLEHASFRAALATVARRN